MILVSAICRLFNFSTRLRVSQQPVKLDVLRLWINIYSCALEWHLPLHLLITLALFLLATAIPSALWAAALTPVPTVSQITGEHLVIPRFSMRTSDLWREWPAQFGLSGPSLHDRRGQFTYSPGRDLVGSLLSSASHSTPLDSAQPNITHGKLDYTQYSYVGRSYGIGSSVGLVDDAITAGYPLALSYTFTEDGYLPIANCIRNESAAYRLTPQTLGNQFVAWGWLPNSGPNIESSTYLGTSSRDDVIVAMGVAKGDATQGVDRSRNFVGFVAGANYSNVDKVQCEFQFRPTRFTVEVGLLDRNITVTPETGVVDVEDIDPTPDHNLTYAAMRQLNMISASQTNKFTSFLGDAINASISNFVISHNHSMSIREATLPALPNVVQSMIDDILVAYASAQLTLGNDTTTAPIEIQTNSIRIGDTSFIYAVVALNVSLVLVIVVEGLRHQGWRKLTSFDYTDSRRVIIGASAGGSGLAKSVMTGVEDLGSVRVRVIEEPGSGGGYQIIAAEDGLETGVYGDWK